MGLSNFPSPAEGVLPVLVMNTVMSVAILKNLVRSVLQLMGATNWVSNNFEENSSTTTTNELCPPNSTYRIRKMRGISITQFKYLCHNNSGKSNSNSKKNQKDSNFTLEGRTSIECCVCLCKFEDEEEVSELSCKHFFHRNCLDKWFDNHHSTCPLCRSMH
ncbi:probable E3 ubiquitin-protein ligase XERICO [Beta vulgaris subsp. vulgaris]|uniref:probable E3 ubiquitin-protein ligase XERICO n=1 Tax=Beta vulgaris subsp. vulgaris TaxID=3555 RepID=UPI002037670A|nr:probable E3 ubiquitin-protein ligase XERICO [Beta vulgaris subsp. vulgaris]